MANQILTFVALPNGLTAKGKLRVSVYLTPRLQGAATLDKFPDMLYWAARIKKRGMKLTLASGANTATVAVNPAVLRPDVWNSIFKAKTFVEKYQVPPLDKNLLVSYPSRDVMSFVKFAYQALSSRVLQTGTYQRENPLAPLLSDLVFRQGPVSNLKDTLSQLRVTLWREQQSLDFKRQSGKKKPRAKSASATFAAALPPDGVPTQTSLPPATRAAMTQFALFHHMPSAKHRPPLPTTEAGFAKTLDFHKAISALNSYPSLLRALGLVFDLEVPASLCAFSPAAPSDSYATIAVQSVSVGSPWKSTPQYCLPPTSYLLTSTEFAAAPATPFADLPNQNYLAGDVIGGLLALSPQFFYLNQVDLDGVGLNLLSLADNVAFVSYRNPNNQSNPVEIEPVLPSFRSGGIQLMADGRGMQLLQAIRDNQAFDQALQANSPNTPFPRPLTARDLVRGYRLDIRSAKTKTWYSLHRRNAVYKFGPTGELVISTEDEEGFTQLATAQPAADPKRRVNKIAKAAGAPQPGNDIYIHERIARWNGWSLSVQRPGGSINKSADPAKSVDPDPTVNTPITPFKMTTSFKPVTKSLPKLRFGDRYNLRARTVDLAGNSVPLSHLKPTDVISPNTGQLPYLRFEPVLHPVLLLLQTPQPGGSLMQLVIRSFNNKEALDGTPSTAVDQRHIIPPRIAVRMAEQHGMFDDAKGELKGDAATYNLIITRDKAEFPAVDGVPIDPRPQIPTPYLPDPFARGAAFRNLPNTPSNTNGKIRKAGLTYSVLPDVEPRPGSVTYIDFGSTWPARQTFRLAIVEGKKKPAWDAANRVLTVYLPKATIADVPLSCYLNPGDLSVMGIWGWLREFFEANELASAGQSLGPVFPTDSFAMLTRFTLEGGHPMITPSTDLTLVHAVQQPLGHPEFTVLSILHQPGPSGKPGAVANAFAPITAWRALDSHSAVLLGGLHVNAKSTSKIDLQATWWEFTDDLSQPGPVKKPASSHVEKIDLSTLDQALIYADVSQTRAVATYIPQGDTLWFSVPTDRLPGLATPSEVAAPRHQFNDTKHRKVRYQAIATSRFQEYFPAGLKFTRSSPRLMVNVPSSARPAIPEVAYIVPIFGSEQQETTNIKTAIRRGNGLRVYLQRPWYSSGQDELLGVVLWPQSRPTPDTPTREKYKSYFTQWGLDPIWKTEQLEPVPASYNFPRAAAQAQSLNLEETDLPVDVAAHCVAYDAVRKMWYCDIVFENDYAYMPFVRLAFARYQGHSLSGVELSHAVLADFAQLTPDRSAAVSVDPSDPRNARVFVGGLIPEGPTKQLFTVTVEKQMTKAISDVGWAAAPANEVNVTEDPPGSGNPDAMLWAGSIHFAKVPPKGIYRVVVREFEILLEDRPTTPQSLKLILELPSYAQRLVYAAILPYDFPSS
ncbi:MAG: hypothetical protein WB439_05385 [Acidobacteriaceae bacterium]